MRIILASGSESRKRLMQQAGINFEIIPSRIDESRIRFLDPAGFVEALAKAKAGSVFKANPDAIVIGADTIVYLDGRIIGKPADRGEAISTLKHLSGKTHKVFTGLSIIKKEQSIVEHCVSEVDFNELTDSMIQEYLEKADPTTKAGAYNIDEGKGFIKEIRGSRTNVIGLPMESVKKYLSLFRS